VSCHMLAVQMCLLLTLITKTHIGLHEKPTPGVFINAAAETPLLPTYRNGQIEALEVEVAILNLYNLVRGHTGCQPPSSAVAQHA
jgi:hypothetical protein